MAKTKSKNTDSSVEGDSDVIVLGRAEFEKAVEYSNYGKGGGLERLVGTHEVNVLEATEERSTTGASKGRMVRQLVLQIDGEDSDYKGSKLYGFRTYTDSQVLNMLEALDGFDVAAALETAQAGKPVSLTVGDISRFEGRRCIAHASLEKGGDKPGGGTYKDKLRIVLDPLKGAEKAAKAKKKAKSAR